MVPISYFYRCNRIRRSQESQNLKNYDIETFPFVQISQISQSIINIIIIIKKTCRFIESDTGNTSTIFSFIMSH